MIIGIGIGVRVDCNGVKGTVVRFGDDNTVNEGLPLVVWDEPVDLEEGCVDRLYVEPRLLRLVGA